MISLYDRQRKLVLEALSMEGTNLDLPKKQFWLGNSDELTRDQIFIAVRAFTLALNSSSGNSGGRNLYELNDLYLTNPEARAEINNVLIEFGRDRFC